MPKIFLKCFTCINLFFMTVLKSSFHYACLNAEETGPGSNMHEVYMPFSGKEGNLAINSLTLEHILQPTAVPIQAKRHHALASEPISSPPRTALFHEQCLHARYLRADCPKHLPTLLPRKPPSVSIPAERLDEHLTEPKESSSQGHAGGFALSDISDCARSPPDQLTGLEESGAA